MTGRPRKRPLDETLRRALEVFWDKGYAATSIGDISAAVGVGPSSLYNSFGSKSGLYTRALEQYSRQEGQALMAPLATEAHVIDGLIAVLRLAVVQYTSTDCPHGCAVMAAGRVQDVTVDQVLVQLREASVAALSDRIAEAGSAGQLRAGASADGIARFVAASLQGLSSQARDGVSAEALNRAVDIMEVALEGYRAPTA